MKIRFPFQRNPKEMAKDTYRVPRRRRPRRMRLLVVLATLGLLVSGFIYWRPWAQAAPAAATTTTVPVTQGDLEITVESSGSVQPSKSVDLSFPVGGQIREVLVKPGQRVTAGQPLARLDDRDLRLQVQQAEADLKSAEAQFTGTLEGSSTTEDLKQAQATVKSAQAQLEKARTGNVTAADIANAEAAVRSAEANLARVRSGNVTAADIANAEAAVRSAEANLARVRTGNVTAADIANAEAAVRSAEAQLEKAKAGPDPDKVSAAEARLRTAQQNYEKIAANGSANKTTAQQNMLKAADSVRLAQAAYSSARWDNEQAQAGRNPKTGQRFEDEGLDPAAQQRQYEAALQSAQLQLSQAETSLEQAKVAYENAKQQEINDNAAAQAEVDDARVQLDQVLKGPKSFDVTQAQAQVDQAKAQLAKLRQGGTAADVTQAQAQVDQAKAQLAKLRQGGTAADVTQAQAQVDQAKAQLAKLRQGGTAADIAAARAQVEQSQAGLEKLTAPAAEKEIATADAQVAQAQAKLEAAKLKLDQAVLTAPFDATIAKVNVVAGSYAVAGGGASAAFTLVDMSSMHLDISLSESDVARITPGQTVNLSFDALEGQVITGTVESVAPTGTEQNNVVTYLVQAQFKPGNAPVKVGMTANASIVVERHAGVIQVPSRAITSAGPAKTLQVVFDPAKPPATVRVQTGATNGSLTEIVSCVDLGKQCLREGDQVQVSLPTGTVGPGGGMQDGVMFRLPGPGPVQLKQIPLGP